MSYESNQIRFMLSQYMDGELDESARLEVERLISENPEYAKVLADLKSLRASLERAVQEEKTLNVWGAISRQLKQDGRVPVTEYDFEFVSAYYDNEVVPAERHEFESQLFQNDTANGMLGDIDILSENVRGYARRLEANCTLDITSQVMALYNAEESAEDLPEATERQALLSAYLDRELSSRDTINANRLIENELAYQTELQALSRLQHVLQGHFTRLQEQAPDVWPAVAAKLETEAKVVSLSDRKPSKSARWIASLGIPAAVAAVLMLMVSPSGITPELSPELERQVMPSAASESMAGLSDLPSDQLAAVSAPRGGGMQKAAYQFNAAAGSQAQEPAGLSSEDIVSAGLTLVEAEEYSGNDVPSSEEYLFDVLDAKLVDVAEQQPAPRKTSKSE